MLYKSDWEQAKVKWANYWKGENTGRPLMCVIARKPEIENAYQEAAAQGKKMYAPTCQGVDPTLPKEWEAASVEDQYQNPARMVQRYRHFCENHLFLAESFPNINVDFGPGSMAGYLGSEIVFNEDTVWFEHCVEDWGKFPPIAFNPENKWWKKHYALVEKVRELAGDDFYVGMPDLMENIDVLASLRGTQDMIFDMVDEPEMVAKRIKEVGETYYEYYERLYEATKSQPDGGSCYTVFQIWGPGRTAKLQCDFAAMMSPDHFEEFIVDSLRQQAKKLDNVLFHLDGPDCIKHMDALMQVEEIDALQWTSGDYGPDGTMEEWYPIYDKARAAGKSIWVKVYTGGYENWVKNADRMVERYGSHSLFFHFPEMSAGQAEGLLRHADTCWRDKEGNFKP